MCTRRHHRRVLIHRDGIVRPGIGIILRKLPGAGRTQVFDRGTTGVSRTDPDDFDALIGNMQGESGGIWTGPPPLQKNHPQSDRRLAVE